MRLIVCLILIITSTSLFSQDCENIHLSDSTSDTLYFKKYCRNNKHIVLEGWLIAGKKEGYWKEYYKSGGIKQEGTYHNDIENGFWKYYAKNGTLKKEGNYYKGLKDGYWYFYDNEGQVSSQGEFKDNQKVGFWKEFKKGIIHAEGWYKDDKPFGEWNYFDKQGNLAYTVNKN